MGHFILVINPGSTSTKIALFEDDVLLFENKITHSTDELKGFASVSSQYTYRKDLILDTLNKQNFEIKKLNAICGRGGLLRPIESGTYIVNDKMLNDLKEAKRGEHASNLGASLAFEIAKDLNIPAFIVDPVAVDEMDEIARISGIKEISRPSLFHALNHKAIGRKVAQDYKTTYESLNLIIAHLGGGISVGAHHMGRVVDVNNALDGDGPMSPERSGSLPLGPLYKMCFSGNYTLKEIQSLNYGKGGLVSYLNTNDAKEVVKRIKNNDNYAKLIYDAMGYQIAKEIGSCATVLKGNVDFIVLTGGLAYETYLVEYITSRVKFISKIIVYPGEDEMLALALGALRVLKKQETAKIY